MNKNIKLNNKVEMDLFKYREGKLLLQANTGGGKSYAIRRILEQSFDKIPQIILDTEGEFSTLRQKYDYILIGKGQDITADHKTAGLLAHRLIQERVSAVIDLFEMSPWEREEFVKNFVSAMTNAPHSLWLPTVLVIDEAQTYAPEGERTECGKVLHDAAFKFRKRHFGMVFATQRIASLSKNIISTCKNKLIGYTSLENDVKRAAYELGFTNKDQWRSLRDLEPGHFFAFGPAISREVTKIQIGEVFTAHGDDKEIDTKVITPSAKIKKALAALADLPKAAAEEARTITEFKKEIVQLKTQLTIAKQNKPAADPKAIEKAVKEAVHAAETNFWKQRDEWLRHMQTLFKVIETIGKTASAVKMPDLKMERKALGTMHNLMIDKEKLKVEKPFIYDKPFSGKMITMGGTEPLAIVSDGIITMPEKKILNAIAWCESIGKLNPPEEMVAFLSGYSHILSSGYRNPRSALSAKGLIVRSSGTIDFTPQGRALAECPTTVLSQEELHRIVLEKLEGPEQRVLKPLLEAYPQRIVNAELCVMAGYSHELSSGYRNPRSRLNSFGLIDYHSKDGVKAADFLFFD